MKHILKYKRKGTCLQINLCKSAPIQIKPICIIQELAKHWTEKGYREVIDVGCGKLRNSLALVNHFRLWICDFADQLNNPSLRSRLTILKRSSNFKAIVYADTLGKGLINADAALMCSVLHTIPEKRLRQKLIRNTVKNLNSPYEIFVAAPQGESYYRDNMKQENRFNDGFLFGLGRAEKTFYREYSPLQLDRFMAELGFSVDREFHGDKKAIRCYLKKR